MSMREDDPFEQVVRALPEPVLVLSLDGAIHWANPAAATLNGGRAPVPGRSLCELVENGEKELRAYLRLCSLTSSATIGSLAFRCSDRERVRWRCEGWSLRASAADRAPRRVALRFRTEQSASARFALLNHRIDRLSQEIGARKRIEREHAELVLRARQAQDDAESANRMKDEFLATLSHELRTPLSAILGWVYLMRGEVRRSDGLQRGLETIERNARLQTQLIDDLLDLSRIASGKVELSLEQVDLVPLLREACESLLPAAKAKQVMIVNACAEQPALVAGDPHRLRQIVWNLLSNAVKFTPQHGTVQLALERCESELEIVVRDDGRGIAPELLPHIFERFRQGDASSSRQHGGLGLGLAIARYLTELHGGRIRAESEGNGRGAVFSVRLPALTVLPESRASVGPDLLGPQVPRLHALRILLVEDNVDTREMLTDLLERSGASVHAVTSAAEGVQAARQTPPDLVISDIEMPAGDGYSFIRQLRALETSAGRRAPAIALTAYARAEDRLRALEAGFQLHLAKPVDPPQLLRALLQLSTRSDDD